MAEIEFFCDPQDLSHAKFEMVQDDILPLLSAKSQDTAENMVVRDVTLGEAVEQGLINNQIIAYFMGRTFKFLQTVGIRNDAIRFRQHRSNEMAHYACDCWDAEVETSYGWIEVAGHSHRSAFDLERHAAKSKVDLVAARQLKEEVTLHLVNMEVQK